MLLLLPLLLVSQRQSAQVAWLPRPDLESVDRLLEAFTGPAVAGPCLVLIVVAVHPPFAGRGLTLQTVALPLMVVPPAVLIGVSQFSPLYDDRYVLYALAGAPLLVAAGAERLAGAVSRLRAKRPKGGIPRPLLAPFARVPAVPLFRVPAVSLTRVPAVALIGVLAIALALVCQLPLLRQDRIPDRRPDNLAAVSAVAGRELRPGDPVLFVPALARRSALAYPKGFHGVWDVALRVPAPVSGTLYGKETGPGELRRRLERLDRVWVVTEPFALRPTWYPSSATERVKLAVVYEEFVARQEVVRKGVTLRLYVRRPPIRLVEWAAAD
jgi:mannosyltransferase